MVSRMLVSSFTEEAIMTTQEKIPADYRSAKTGQFVTKEYAQHHPATTIKEHNKLLPLTPSDRK